MKLYQNLNVTGSLTLTGSLNTVGTITATTLVVQTITSSITRMTGSTSFGSSSINNHNFTGSLIVSGAMFVSSSGNVGIGTLVPTNKLDVVNAGVNAIRVQNTLNTSDSYLIAQNTLGSTFFGINATGGYIYNLATLPILFYTSGSERMRITATGSVGIGTTSPSYTLSFGGDAATTIGMNQSILGTAPALTLRGADSTTGTNNEGGPIFISSGLGTGNGATSNIIFSTGAPGGSGATRQTLTERMRITAAGNVGIGTSSPNAAAYAGRVLTIGNGTTYENALELNGYNITDDTLSDVAFLNGASSDVDKRVCLVRANRSGANNSGALLFYTKNSGTFGERMRITNAGNVCIGTTTSAGYGNINLDLNAGSLPAAYFVIRTASNGVTAEYAIDAGNAYLSTKTSHDLVFRTSDVERFRIKNTGNLDFQNTFISWGYDNQGIKLSKSGVGPKIALWANTQYLYLGYAETGGWERVYAQATSAGVYLTNGATSWTANSDERLKNINSNIENAVDKLSTLRTVNYSWKSDELNRKYLGLIAQDVQEVLPEVIDIDEKDEIGTLGVRYTELIPVLVKAIQELKAEIDELKNK